MNFESSTNRSFWEFEYSTKDLAVAAAAKRDFHGERVTFWRQAKKDKIEEIKKDGVTVEESVVEDMLSGISNMSAYGKTMAARGPVVNIDVELSRDLAEIHGKIQTHERLTKEYGGWAEIFEKSPVSQVKLKADDWLYFFSKPELMASQEQ